MAHSFHPELLSALLDGQLSPEQKALVEEHLQNHAQDAAVYEDLQRLHNQLRGLPVLSAPADFKQRVLQRVHESAAIPVFAAIPSTRRSANNTVWLLACAASLAALLLAGVLFSLNRNDSRLIADVDVAQSKPQQPAGFKTGPENAPNESAETPIGNDATVQSEKPAPGAMDRQRESLGKSIAQAGSAGEIAPPPPASAMADQVDDANVQAIDDGSLAKELSQQVAPAPVEQWQNRAVFGGGGGERATVDADPLAEDGAKPSSGLVDAPSGAVAEPVAPSDICVRLDQLIFVQVPANQPADEWIASIFRQAEVQMDPSDEPNSFGELVQLRDDKKQTSSESENSQVLPETEKQEAQDARAMAEKSQPELSPAPEYLKPDQTTTAYWVDAEVQQIRTIMDRLDGAVIVGFSSNGNQSARGAERLQQKSFRGNTAFAQRLPLLGVPQRSDNSAKDKQPNRQRDEEGSSKTQQAIDALGLQYQPHTARYRILFVFHGTAAPAAIKVDAVESKPEPVK